MRKASKISRPDAARSRDDARARAASDEPQRSRIKADQSPRMAELAVVRDALRHAGLRSTAPRIAVIDQLRHATAPLSHDQIAIPLLAFGFDRATIYRNLKDLAEAGVITRLEVGDYVHRYEMRPTGAGRSHPHFLCTICGAISCLTAATVKISTKGHLQLSNVSEVVLKGHCVGCASRTERRVVRSKSRPPRT